MKKRKKVGYYSHSEFLRANYEIILRDNLWDNYCIGDTQKCVDQAMTKMNDNDIKTLNDNDIKKLMTFI